MLNVALVVGFNSDLEAQSIRASLEYFGARVVTYWIGRPNDFVEILSGKNLYNDINYVVFCFHGEEGKFVMEELGEDIYEQDEPRGNFGVKEIYKYAKLHNTHIVNSGCTLGEGKLAELFLYSGAKSYIGSIDYVDGNAALMFTIRLFYSVINHDKTLEEAFQEARLIDEETDTFRLYK
ncbi:TPA: delta-aminolevulinic acid dehydratase [Bacillus toyonensis]|uniref:delta-aminolevulinic acid dehydratase n=1 Tax=Bacillus toyonensis TaxID=155322 RepID=UPI000BFB3C03|nr:delta-aminolevulinic acid dehydratase [Bacillus toyonensis]PHA91651.1 delta-aminolevulinic acid dehydratase [Bacillus toyonensis]QWI07243.1 delta-aminolevulinic acid dehydratase [Bacillus toyonensis]HDR7381495.1 delta-aminolevulinic acid dehydratase [Bacillus toyonensis]